MTNYSIQDFSIIQNKLERIQNELGLSARENSFYFMILNLILKLQEDEVYESVTDTNFLINELQHNSGNDRGIDAVYIESINDNKKVVHLFNFKYKQNFEGTKGNFPSGEIDKIQSTLRSFFSKDETLRESINLPLYEKFEELYKLHDEGKSIDYRIYLCSNCYHKLLPNEEKRFREFLEEYNNITFDYILMGDIIQLLLNKDRIKVNAKIKLIDKNFFETGSGDIRAIICQVDIRELLKCVIRDEDSRIRTDYQNYSFLNNAEILKDAFEDNVRVYLKDRTAINRSIKNTALNELENSKMFYYNNGITITCSDFKYPQNFRSPVLEIENLQIVNGGQTVRALFDAYKEKPNILSNVDVLCRIYKIQDKAMSTKISEYTNNQNPVRSRDIRSIDSKQIKLEAEFRDLGYFYERKKNQHEEEERKLRIDSEKSGQVILAFYCEKPSEAKNKKSVIFGDEYENIFLESRTAEDILIPLKVFDQVDSLKKEYIKEISKPEYKGETNFFVKYSSYYLLFLLKRIADYRKIPISRENVSKISEGYPLAISILRYLVDYERSKEGKNYNDAYYFKSNKLKENYQKLEEKIIQKFLMSDTKNEISNKIQTN
jgi:hypothetical protein